MAQFVANRCHTLSAPEIIRRVEDRSLTTQRRIVILNHPNAV
jgi:hypothetical protein